ncbi:hypothetical protein [Tissierella sp.]|uniref:hypothetical protein n=1 Tax=Tissierella sp. TaxID=41274 RepID=UPI0030465F3A
MKCFADNGKKCTALRIKDCKGCVFFKTQEQVEESEKKAMDRINSLGEYIENNVINTYFLGGLR